MKSLTIGIEEICSESELLTYDENDLFLIFAYEMSRERYFTISMSFEESTKGKYKNKKLNAIYEKALKLVGKYDASTNKDFINELSSYCTKPSAAGLYIFCRYLGAKDPIYRPNIITGLEKYLTSGIFKPILNFVHVYYLTELKNGMPYSQTLTTPKDMHLANTYLNLAYYYRSTYNFNKAMEYSTKAYELVPFYSFAIAEIVNTYRAMNRLDSAISFLKEQKNLIYYKEAEQCYEIINTLLVQQEQALAQNYVYRPRPRKLKEPSNYEQEIKRFNYLMNYA